MALLAEYEGSRIALSLYLAAGLHEAIEDLRRQATNRTGDCADMFDRFLGWHRRRT